MIKEDGRCRAIANAICIGEDAVVSAECKKKPICVNFTAKACRFVYGNGFHCEGILSGDDGELGRLELGKQNLYCSLRLNESESFKDIGISNNEGETHMFCPELVRLFTTIIVTTGKNRKILHERESGLSATTAVLCMCEWSRAWDSEAAT